MKRFVLGVILGAVLLGASQAAASFIFFSTTIFHTGRDYRVACGVDCSVTGPSSGFCTVSYCTVRER